MRYVRSPLQYFFWSRYFINNEKTNYRKYKKEVECDICAIEKNVFFECMQCKNKYCKDCHVSWKAKTCPFCRKKN